MRERASQRWCLWCAAVVVVVAVVVVAVVVVIVDFAVKHEFAERWLVVVSCHLPCRSRTG